MRITLDLDDRIVRAVRREAAESGRTMTEVSEGALRRSLPARSQTPAEPFRLRLVTVKGRRKPAVDCSHRDSLFEILEGRS
ncbi:MAG: hypothetical protein DWQ36_19520 [Acidobacteria bacterium]|nr:MAG: hypothetical protein DWQ30_06120 [Acidobacteriota bacterium]REK03730.1 MAG: hypothetical protein DWQ36_19520 [Acidobacteriota bacterium]